MIWFSLVVSEEISFENVDDADNDNNDGRRTTVYPISSPGALSSVELKKHADSEEQSNCECVALDPCT